MKYIYITLDKLIFVQSRKVINEEIMEFIAN